MAYLPLENEWLSELLPSGLPIPGSTLLTGPGGSGKPLIGNLVAASWLRQGGSVIFMSLQYPDHSFIAAGLEKVAGLALEEYQDQVAFIELDTSLPSLTDGEGSHFRANLVKPDVWESALDRALGMVPDQEPGVMIFISAINLLLFSPTYGDQILEKIIQDIHHRREVTFLISASTTAKADQIARLEEEVDNLILTRSKRPPLQLFLKIQRMKEGAFITREVKVPFRSGTLDEVKEIADHSRKKVIPQVSKL